MENGRKYFALAFLLVPVIAVIGLMSLSPGATTDTTILGPGLVIHKTPDYQVWIIVILGFAFLALFLIALALRAWRRGMHHRHSPYGYQPYRRRRNW